MYHIYHTPALLFHGRSLGEGDRMLYLYTRDLGLVVAHAKSLREQRSKLRYALQTFASAEVDLVQGKRGWKIISARPITLHAQFWNNEEKRRIAARYAELSMRLIQGQESDRDLFEDISGGFSHLHQAKEDSLPELEALLIVRLLARLGYWGSQERFMPLIASKRWDEKTLAYAKEVRGELFRKINDALRETQL